MNSNEKLMNFTHFYNSCTRNGDLFILLIKTGNTLKQRILPQLSLTLFKSVKGIDRNTIKTGAGGQMVVAFTITEIS